MQKEDLLKSIISMPLEMASYPNIESMFLFGERIRPVPDEYEKFSRFTIGISNAFTNCFVTVANPDTIEEIEDNIIKGFMYMFDKSVELLYLLEYGDISEFDYQITFESGFYLNDYLPYKVQECLTPLISKVNICIRSTLQEVEEMDTSLLTIDELTSTILMGAAWLAFELFLRMDADMFR